VFRQEVFAEHNFDTYTINISSGADPAIGLYRRYTCDNDQNAVFGNATGYCNPDLDAVFLAAGAANEQSERTPLYTEAQQIIADIIVQPFGQAFLSAMFVLGFHIVAKLLELARQDLVAPEIVDGPPLCGCHQPGACIARRTAFRPAPERDQ